MLIFPPVPVPKIKGIDPDLLKVILDSKIFVVVEDDKCCPRQKNFVEENSDLWGVAIELVCIK